MRPDAGRVRITLAIAIVAVIAMSGRNAYAQVNPYREVKNWAKLPEGRTWGQVPSVTVDHHGNVWAFERCGGSRSACADSNLAPILEFDPSGTFLKSFGEKMFVFPHGIFLDKDGNLWVTDVGAKDGKGQQVFKFSPEGKLMLTLGKAGISGDGPDTFNEPTAVVVAPNGDIFVANGHGGNTNPRIVKFSRDGTLIKAWGKKGSAPGELSSDLHAIAMDSKGRLFVGDRGNNRIQIFNQDGKVLEEWKQFGSPSGIFIDAKDTIYVTDSESDEKVNPGFKKGIRIGSAKDGLVRNFIPALGPADKPANAAEGVAADAMGNVYAAESSTRNLRKYVRE